MAAGQLGRDHGIPRRAPKTIYECPCVRDDDHRVEVAVDDEERRCVAVEIRKGRGPNGGACVDASVVPAEADRSRDRSVHVRESGLKHGIIGCQCGESSQMRTRGGTRHEDRPWVRAILDAVLAHPRQHSLQVDERVGEPRTWKQPIVGADAHPSLAREAIDEREGLAVLPATSKRSAMQMDEDRSAAWARAMTVEIEEIPSPVFAIADVCQPFDIATLEDERGE